MEHEEKQEWAHQFQSRKIFHSGQMQPSWNEGNQGPGPKAPLIILGAQHGPGREKEEAIRNEVLAIGYRNILLYK